MPIVALRTLFRQPAVAQPPDLDLAAAAMAFEALSNAKPDHERTDDESGVGPHHALTYSTLKPGEQRSYELI
jgi:hypothetical protein